MRPTVSTDFSRNPRRRTCAHCGTSTKRDRHPKRAAAALDRLAPLLLNWLAGGRTWHEVGVTEAMARAVNEPVAAAAGDELLALVRAILDDARDRNWFVLES